MHTAISPIMLLTTWTLGSIIVGVLIGSCIRLREQHAKQPAPADGDICGEKSPLLPGFVCTCEPHGDGHHYFTRAAS